MNDNALLDLPGVNIIGFFSSESGLGQAVRNVHRSFKKSNVPCVILNLDYPSMKQQENNHLSVSNSNSHKINLFNVTADQSLDYFTKIDHSLLLNHYNIGYFNWELETFPEFLKDAFFFYDEIWTPSTFTQQSIQSQSPIPVHVVPYSVDIANVPEHFNREHFKFDPNAFIFLFVFDCNSILPRKNPDAVINAFKRAFNHLKDVKLVIKMTNGANYREAVASLEQLASENPNIQFIDQLLMRQESHALMQACDVFVSLHRSEGFGLNLCEAMTMGKPVIATNYSANVDYMNDSNAYLVDFKKIAVQENYGPYLKGELWAEPDIEHAASLMRHLYANREEAKQKGLNAQQKMQKEYSDDAAGQKIVERLKAIQEKGMRNHSMRFKIHKNKFNLVEDYIPSNRSIAGPFINAIKRIVKSTTKPVLGKQTRINILQDIKLDDALKRIENLEKEIKALKEK